MMSPASATPRNKPPVGESLDGREPTDDQDVWNARIGGLRHNSVKRCAFAVGEGALAVTSVHRYLEKG